MAGKTLTDVVRDLGRTARLQAALALSDAQLLEQFVERRDETAFEALLHRHGPLVFGVCRKLLYDVHDAEDAFQATFLVLARKAGAIGRRSLLGNWLYGVAYRVAVRARKSAARRDRQQVGIELADVADMRKPADTDLASLLHEEVQRLPDKYRCLVVLCYLEGKTNEEAADHLHCPVGTVKGRLNRAREMLRARLMRRGVALSAGLLAAGLVPAASTARAGLFAATAKAGLCFASGNAAAGGLASAQAVALTKGVLQAMFLSKWKSVAALVLSVAVLAGAGSVAYRALAVEPAKQEDASKPDAKDKADKPKEDKDAILGIWKVVSVEFDGKKDPAGEDFDALRKVKAIFTKEKLILQLADADGDDPPAKKYTYKLDPSKKPKAIDIEGEGETGPSVYSLEGDTLKLCLPNAGKGGGDRPTEIAAKEGDGRILIVLKREAEEKPKEK
jgi:RNA polymerase sigma factor (sigma-70 family)